MRKKKPTTRMLILPFLLKTVLEVQAIRQEKLNNNNKKVSIGKEEVNYLYSQMTYYIQEILKNPHTDILAMSNSKTPVFKIASKGIKTLE